MKNFLLSLFVPTHKNNHRAKLLHNSSIFLLLTFLLIANIAFGVVKTNHPDILGIAYSINDQDLLSITNKVRAQNNLPPLDLNGELTSAAEKKAQDMFAKNYWAHFAPDGTSPWYFIKSAKYNYIYAGENLAKGFTASTDVVNAWMNSPSHRENILSDKYKDVGFAVVEGNLSGEDTVLVVEMFGSTQAPVYAESDISKEFQASPAAQGSSNQPSSMAKVENTQLPILGENNRNNFNFQPLIDSISASKTLLLFLFSIFLMALLIDLIVIERKKIPRLVGHNLDHIMLIVFFILFVIFENYGAIF